MSGIWGSVEQGLAEDEANKIKLGQTCDGHMAETFKSFGSCQKRLLKGKTNLMKEKIKTFK